MSYLRQRVVQFPVWDLSRGMTVEQCAMEQVQEFRRGGQAQRVSILHMNSREIASSSSTALISILPSHQKTYLDLRRTKRPIESTRPIHILSRLHNLILPDPKVLIIPGHLLILRTLEPRKPHHLSQHPRHIVFIQIPYLILHYLHIFLLARLLLIMLVWFSVGG